MAMCEKELAGSTKNIQNIISQQQESQNAGLALIVSSLHDAMTNSIKAQGQMQGEYMQGCETKSKEQKLKEQLEKDAKKLKGLLKVNIANKF